MTRAIQDLVVIGAGPAGYVGAIRARQLGLRVRLVERADLGGICLNWGCIPTKTLLHAADVLTSLREAESLGIRVPPGMDVDLPRMVQRSREVANRLRQGVGHLLHKHGVEVLQGQATLKGQGLVDVASADGRSETLHTDAVLIATGASPRALDGLPVDGERIWNYRHALQPDCVPNRLLVVGAGAIGMEFASFYAALGSRVCIMEARDTVLPTEDADISAHMAQAFQQRGITLHTNATARMAGHDDDAVLIELDHGGERTTHRFDRVLVCAGVTPNSQGLGLENTAVRLESGCLVTDPFGRTDEPGIYAAGDVRGAPMLAHKASHEAVRCVEHMAGLTQQPDARLIPACTYCTPQVASIGLTEAQARATEHDLAIGRFPFHGNGKALAMGSPEGFIKTIFNRATGELLGAHLVGPEVTELIQGLSLARQLEATEEDLMQHIHAHPTLSEAIGESVLAAFGRAVHI